MLFCLVFSLVKLLGSGGVYEHFKQVLLLYIMQYYCDTKR